MNTTDGTALLAAIAANPDEDTPRLMYADWCDENDQPEHAELIRLQCGSPAPVEAYCGACDAHGHIFNGSQWVDCPNCNVAPAIRRETDLLDLLRPQLCPVCPVCDGTGHEHTQIGATRGSRKCDHCRRSGIIGEIRRGFLWSVTVPSMRTLFEYTPPKWGYLGEWHPTQWARDLLRKCPVLQRIEVADVIREEDLETWKPDVPVPVWHRLKSGSALTSGGGYTLREYPERKDQIADLSQAILATLREMIAAEKGVTT